MCYIVEVRTPSCPAAYVLAQAASRDDARAMVDAEFVGNEDCEDMIIVAIHLVH